MKELILNTRKVNGKIEVEGCALAMKVFASPILEKPSCLLKLQNALQAATRLFLALATVFSFRTPERLETPDERSQRYF